MPILDRYKSFVPFCAAVTASVPASVPLYGYQPDETLRGAVPFLYRTVLDGNRDPARHWRKPSERRNTAFVVIRDKNGKTEEELLSTGRFTVLARLGMDTARSVVLFATRPVP